MSPQAHTTNLYYLHKFCIDELQGTLLGFEERVAVQSGGQVFEGRHRMDLEKFEGLTEHIFVIRYLTVDRFMRASNREAVDLVLSPKDSPRTWKATIFASIGAHHKKTVLERNLYCASNRDIFCRRRCFDLAHDR